MRETLRHMEEDCRNSNAREDKAWRRSSSLHYKITLDLVKHSRQRLGEFFAAALAKAEI